MQRVIEEMSKAKSDVERRLRKCIPEIIRECSAFGYLGKNFTFDVSNLSDKVNQRLISLSDEILSDIEERARRASEYAEEEDDEYSEKCCKYGQEGLFKGVLMYCVKTYKSDCK